VKPFNLIRYFAVASLGVVVTLALVTAYTFSRNLEQSLTEEAGLYAQDISSSLNRVIFSDFVLPREREGHPFDLEDPAQRRGLDAIVANRVQGLRILTVILFDRSGTIVYSNKPDYIGYRSIDNPGLTSALSGKPASLLKRAELERNPLSPGHDLLETYSPFYELDPASGHRGELIGVLELYQDARPITAKIAQGQRQILLATAGLMVVLFLALFAIVRRGHQRITELTRALERSNEDLEQRVRERTLEIETAQRQVAQSAHLAAMGEMAAAVAHEIRNPIGMIQSAAQLLESGPELPERERKLLRAIREETGRVGRTVSEFVGFATPPAPSRSVTDPAGIVDRVQTMLKPEAERRGVELVVALDPQAPKIRVDPELIYRALTNLVLNAIQVQRAGGRVEVRTSRCAPGEVGLHVVDSGPGIPAEDLPRIFDPFFTRRPGGTGLGLSVVQRVVTAHGGHIDVTSRPEHTEFTLRFPEETA